MLYRLVLQFLLIQFLLSHFVLAADGGSSAKVQISGSGEMNVETVVPRSLEREYSLAMDTLSDEDSVATSEQQDGLKSLIRRERISPVAMPVEKLDQGSLKSLGFHEAQVGPAVQFVQTDSRPAVAVVKPVSNGPLSSGGPPAVGERTAVGGQSPLRDQAAVAGRAVTERQEMVVGPTGISPSVESFAAEDAALAKNQIGGVPEQPVYAREEVGTVMARHEACVCMPAWQDYMSGPPCAKTQFGCPSVICDSDILPWCIVSNPGCITEEFSEGGGWAYCDPKKNNPFDPDATIYKRDRLAKETGTSEFVRGAPPDRFMLFGLMIVPVALVVALIAFCDGSAVKMHMAKLTGGTTNQT